MYSKECVRCKGTFQTNIRHANYCKPCMAPSIPSFEKQCISCHCIFVTPNKSYKLCAVCLPPRKSKGYKSMSCKSCHKSFGTLSSSYEFCRSCFDQETNKAFKNCSVCKKKYQPMVLSKHPYTDDPNKDSKCNFCWGKELKGGKIAYIDNISEELEICQNNLEKLLDSDE